MSEKNSLYPLLSNENERLAALHSFHILDTAEEKDFDDLTALASAICQTPIALISLVDQDRQWFKSHKGLPASETSRDFSFCAHAITSPNELLIVPDASLDNRFSANPLVTGDTNIVFYAGVPLVSSEGFALGSLCIIDHQTRELTIEQINALTILAKQVMAQLELRKKTIQLSHAKEQLELSLEKLESDHHELAETQMKLEQAIETGKMGSWSFNPLTYEIILSDFVKEMFGFPLEGEVRLDEIIEAIDPEYRGMLQDVLKNAVESHLPSDTEYSITQCHTNERKWVKATGKIFFDNSGNPVEYSGLFMDITERKLDELRKNDFIGMVSHELKTPLTSLNGYVQILHSKAEKTGNAFFVGALNKSALQVKKMTTMINGFLNVSRLNSGKISLQKQSFRLDDLITATLEDILVLQNSHTILFLPSEPVSLFADLDKIGNVISNLLSNAIKYSPLGSTITIHYRVLNDIIQVSVQDKGFGIKTEDIQRLFERYYRVESNQTQLISGFGIGLYLCAEIIEIHEGKIWAESEIGSGSVFHFSLPMLDERLN
ncbi:ATP-binding protein [Pedobacter sp. L105]|uniref:ATP-binding protein n=1 Tax=Pedobacter sp. L105 TaxID=1641871 RepID=UPI00131E74E2|nr:ATP-binding protein [Pedobacter sp. L105]